MKYLTQILLLCCLALVTACASMGRPEGGPRDFDPPVFLYSNPPAGTVNFTGNRVRVYFDENVQVKDVMEKVVVSPAQKIPPSVRAVGRYVQVEFRDTMIPDVTYTIDFSNAISDLNEGNALDGFSTDFSTGAVIDSLRISGMVFEGANLEPAQGMLVGVYRDNLPDSAILTTQFERITKTNELGQFTIRNLSPGTYRLFAVNDANRDYHWDRSEDVAFFPQAVTPRAETVEVTDTLTDAAGNDSLVRRSTTLFTPNDLLLTWFNEGYKPQYLAKNERPERRRINLLFNAPTDTFPVLTLLNGPLAGTTSERWSVRTASVTHDTISYWLSDTLVSGLDSLDMELRYLRTDTLEQLSWTADTMRFYLRGNLTRKAEAKRLADEAEKRRKALEKGDTLPLPKIPVLDVKLAGGDKLDVYNLLNLEISQPLVRFDTTAVRLEMADDTLWVELPPPHFEFGNPEDTRFVRARYAWEPGARYRLTVDSLAMTGAWGETNRTVEQLFSVKRLDEYSSITFTISGLPDSVPAFVEVLGRSDNPIAAAPVADGKAFFEFLNPGDYYARLIVDRNGNGRYDVGRVMDKVLPEDVYYYPGKLKLKRNWDISQTWDIIELPVDAQKPTEIKKNKPAKKRSEMEELNNRRNSSADDDDDDDDDDDYGRQPQNRNHNHSANRPRQQNSQRMQR